MKKYELTDETISVEGRILHRVRALRNFGDGDVEVGDLGGFIESEKNLSHNGNCWVYGNAKVFEGATVIGNAWVFGNARVFENARIFGNALVYGDAQILGDARIFGDARISGKTWIFGNAYVSTVWEEKPEQDLHPPPSPPKLDPEDLYDVKQGEQEAVTRKLVDEVWTETGGIAIQVFKTRFGAVIRFISRGSSWDNPKVLAEHEIGDWRVDRLAEALKECGKAKKFSANA